MQCSVVFGWMCVVCLEELGGEMDCDVVYCLELEWQAGDERQEGAASLVAGLPSFSDTLTPSVTLFSNCFTFQFISAQNACGIEPLS